MNDYTKYIMIDEKNPQRRNKSVKYQKGHLGTAPENLSTRMYTYPDMQIDVQTYRRTRSVTMETTIAFNQIG